MRTIVEVMTAPRKNNAIARRMGKLLPTKTQEPACQFLLNTSTITAEKENRMKKEAIKVYCRVKPVVEFSKSVKYEIENDITKKKQGHIKFFVPEEVKVRHSQNLSYSYNFTFNDIFDQDIEQKEVFEKVAKSVLDNCLKGYNGTIFAYGQTASGKTYTLSGENNFGDVARRKNPLQRTDPMKDPEQLTSSKTQSVATVDVSGGVNGLPKSNELLKKDAKDVFETVVKNAPTTNPALNHIHLPTMQSIAKSSGIIPRTISYLVSFLSMYEAEAEMAVSYYEVYKENGYDLLVDSRDVRNTTKPNKLHQIKAMTDANHNLHIKNLSLHSVRTKKEVLELFEHGNAIRHVAQTHHNVASSRSHCIFTIYLTLKHPETEKILNSKIHLVDLAGSERISKSQETSKTIMKEGKSINLSLHHLQQVIIALSKEKTAQETHKHFHIPYRNSTMTLVLSDSLGGNCCTSMIATISPEEKNLEESISTCRFAQQVATVANKVVVNEVRDSELVISRLKEELEQLKKQLATSLNCKASTADSILTDIMISRLVQMIQNYLKDKDPDAVLDVGSDKVEVQYCFKEMKQRLMKQIEANRKLKAAMAAKQNKKSKTCMIL